MPSRSSRARRRAIAVAAWAQMTISFSGRNWRRVAASQVTRALARGSVSTGGRRGGSDVGSGVAPGVWAGDPGGGLAGQGVRDGLARGEARDGGAAVAEQNPAGAVPVQQGGDDPLRRQGVQPQGPQAFLVRRRQGLAIQQPSRQLGDADIAGLLGQKGVIVPPAVGVEQAQAAEVPGATQLLRGGREQEDAGRLGGEGGHQVVFQAGLGGAPAQVMGLVQDQQVPVGLQDRPGGGGGGQQPLQGAESLGLGEEGVVACRRDLPQPLAVEEGEAQIEAPPHLHQPLVEQGLGHQDQDPRHPPGEE